MDVAGAKRRGIPVVITPGSNTAAVAEGVFSHLLAFVKKLSTLTSLGGTVAVKARAASRCRRASGDPGARNGRRERRGPALPVSAIGLPTILTGSDRPEPRA
ncbi:hypothetical protein ACX80V_17135 [Arthrobacter sp. MDT3-24]